MKNQVYSLLFTALLLTLNSIHLQAQFQFMSPVPGSMYHNPEETIILRKGNVLDEKSLHAKHLFLITGSLSGDHECEIRLIEEKKTIILKPLRPFTEGETVNVQIAEGMKTTGGADVQGTSFSFFIRAPRTAEDNQRIALQMKQLYKEEFGNENKNPFPMLDGEAGFPDFTINANSNPSAGQIFFHNFSFIQNDDSHYCIIENNGDSVFGKFDLERFWAFDLNHNGFLTLFDQADTSFVMLDSNYNEVTTFKMGNGYHVDVHEFQIFPDGHRYMMAYDPQIVDMTVYNPNYSPNATVTGLVIQELDMANNVLFQWRSWDHFQITDCDHINLALQLIDAVHGNSIEKLADGNILISSRHLSELTKINRSTGDIMWRMGGKNNQFTFINDPEKFSFEHDARMLSNGNITVFDNGNYHIPPRSWAKEYEINEVTKTATLVWSYSRNVNGNNIYGNALGSVERLANGNTFICWGNVAGNGFPNITEVDANKNVVWELQLSGDALAIYRSRKHTWQPCARPTASGIFVNKIKSTSAKVNWTAATNASSYDLQYRKQGNVNWKLKTTTSIFKKLKNLSASQTYEYQIRSHCSNVPTPTSAWTSIMTFTTKPLKEMLTEEITASFNLYPNPVGDNLKIEFDLDEAQTISISFYDVTGRIVLHSEYIQNAGGQSIEFDVSKLPAGIYVAEMRTTSGRVVQKFVKE